MVGVLAEQGAVLRAHGMSSKIDGWAAVRCDSK